MKPSRLVLNVVAGVSLLALAGCAPVGDAAIKVKGTTLSNDDVDLFTTFLCAFRADASSDPAAGGTGSAVPFQQARTEAARLLAQGLVADRAADEAQIAENLSGVEQSLTQLDPVIEAAATGDDRERLRSLLISSISSSARIETAVQNAMVAELGEAINQLPQEQGQAIFNQKYSEFLVAGLRGADLEIDPVFGVSEETLEATSDPSLSSRVSQFSRDAATTPSPQEWLDSLPANLRCG